MTKKNTNKTKLLKKHDKSINITIKNDATNYKNWLSSDIVDRNLKNEISKMPIETLKLAFNDKELCFGTAGIRATMGPGTQFLNKFVYRQMAIGYAKYICSRKKDKYCIVIGHDNRMNSDTFALECADVCLAYGIDVILFGKENKLIPTPILSYTIKKMQADGGINITASHNPKTDNGFKAYNNLGAQILPDDAKIIIDNMPSSSEILSLDKILPNSNKGKIIYLDYDKITNEYFDDIAKSTIIDISHFYDKKNPMFKQKIVFTGHGGTTSELIPKFMKKLGFKYFMSVPSQKEINPFFLNSPISNPEDTRSFDAAIQFADYKKANIIIGADPDGDRMAIGFKKTNRWRFLNGNELGIIFMYYLLKYVNYPKTPTILSSYVSTNYIDRIAKKYNAEIIRTKTGFKWMCNIIDELLKKKSFVLAFEEAIGSLVHTICRDKDSFGAILLAMQIYGDPQINYKNVDLHDFLRNIIFNEFGPSYSLTKSYTIISNDWLSLAKKLMKKALSIKPMQISNSYKITKVIDEKISDSIAWFLNNDSWIKFRISGTEPKFKIYYCLNDVQTHIVKDEVRDISKLIEKLILDGIEFKK